MGLGAAAPLFAAATRRYVDDHFGPRPRSRFIALVGDAELDEGNIWEAVADHATQGLGDSMWIVDFNRQSLDRVIPGIRIMQWTTQFRAAGWHVVEVKYGRRLQAKFAEPGGEALREWIDAMPNEQYQSLFALSGPDLRARFLDGAPDAVRPVVDAVSDEELAPLVQDLGGHDLAAMLAAYAECDAVTDRPSVVFAYTVKGWGLPTAGNPRNHSALLTPDQVAVLRARAGLTADTEWDRFDPTSPAGVLCHVRREHLQRPPRAEGLGVAAPEATGIRSGKPTSTQEAFGRVLVDLSRGELAPYLVTTAPDVATSTNLAGFINRTGVYNPDEKRAWNEDPVLKWAEGPGGQHIELGISEMNLFLLLGQLGLSWDLSGQPLIPVGTVYDPFVCRGLDALIYSVYSGARFIVAGTPSGITLAPEGGAHQSTITASIGLELPGVTFIEPAYGVALDWLLCDAVGRIAAGHHAAPTAQPAEEGAFYFRLTTRPIDQAPFEAARQRIGDALLRRQVLAGAYRLVDASALAAQGAPVVHLVGSGAVLPEVLTAAAELADEGIAAHVVDVTSLDRLYGAWQRTLRQGVRTATTPSVPGRAARGLPRSGAGGHRARRRLARDGVAGVRARGAGRPARRRRLWPVRDGRRAVRAARPAPRLDRQCGAGRAGAGLTRAQPAAAASTSGSVRYGIGRARAITVDVRVTPGTASTASTTRWRSALERATTRHSMSPAPVIVCSSSSSGIAASRSSIRPWPLPWLISKVMNAVTV